MSILELVGCPYCFYCINDKIIQYVEHEHLEYPANLDIDCHSQVFKSYATCICQSPIIKFTIPWLS